MAGPAPTQQSKPQEILQRLQCNCSCTTKQF